jgi:hypothetical protein
MEKELPGLRIYLACKDSLYHLLQDQDRTLKQSDLATKLKRKNYAYVREIKYNFEEHPIQKLMEESKIPYPKPPEKQHLTKKGVIAIKSSIGKDMSEDQIQRARSILNNKGLIAETTNNLQGAGWVIGVGNETLYEAAFQGIKTTLVPTGIDVEFYKKLFKGEILDLHA